MKNDTLSWGENQLLKHVWQSLLLWVAAIIILITLDVTGWLGCVVIGAAAVFVYDIALEHAGFAFGRGQAAGTIEQTEEYGRYISQRTTPATDYPELPEDERV